MHLHFLSLNLVVEIHGSYTKYHQQQRETVKDKKTHYGATDEFLLEQKICGSVSTSFIERTGPILLVLVGLMGGREGGRQADQI